MNLLALLCAATTWLVTRRAPQHRSVALALSVCAGLDVFRAVAVLHPRIDMALCLLAPAVSAWLYCSVLGPRDAPAWFMPIFCVVFVIGALTSPVLAWEMILPMCYLPPIAIGACCAINRFAMGDNWTVSQHVALALLAGDVAGLILLFGREWISYQAGVVFGLVTLYQAGWYWCNRDRHTH